VRPQGGATIPLVSPTGGEGDVPESRLERDVILDPAITHSFKRTAAGTRVRRLSVRLAHRGSRIRIVCRSRALGCPFTRKTVRVKGKRAIDLARHFRGSALRDGARVELRITAPGAVGRYVRFTMRPQKRASVTDACLARASARVTSCSG
jgi:hypothetical protein